MGWIFSNWSREALIEELVQPGETETDRYETVAYAIREDVLWSVIRFTPKEPDTSKPVCEQTTAIIGCTLLGQSSGWWGYKTLEEAAHPYYYSCPLRYLEMAPEKSSEWRDRVRAHHAGQPIPTPSALQRRFGKQAVAA
ncbi:hypothetical protein ACO34A_23920 (plasmid) [Rhizobium sp. ACO-34A]|nr:hypothetical protein [Rhizobium sp. ACO-34A]ATN36828.1 hypothetical protein ACO34A_23920 [Rhizobium sp. ACO-34A]